MTSPTDWASAAAIVVSGLILGFMFIYFFGRKRSASVAPSVEMRDLEAKRDSLIAQLQDPQQSPEERTRLELEAANVLREIDRQKRRAPTSPGTVADPMAAAARRAMLIGFAWGAACTLALGTLAYFAMRSATPRPPEPQMASQPQGRPDPVLQQLETRVRNKPEDLDLRIELAQAYLERENLMGVYEQTEYVLARAPQNTRALTYQALVRMAMGQADDARTMLQKATQLDPKMTEAWVTLAWVHMQQGQSREAEQAIGEAIKQQPQERARLMQALGQMRAQAESSRQPASGELPPGHPPIEPSAPAIRVQLELASPAPSTGVVFLYARPAGVTTGAPIAVKRIDARQLPLTVSLSAADSMMGQPLPPVMRLEARLDNDGVATTRSSSEPSAAQDGVRTGQTIRLALR